MRHPAPLRLFFLLAVLLLATLACNLTAGNQPSPTPPPLILSTATPTPTPTATPVTGSVDGPVAPEGPDDSANVVCVPRTDWPLYTVAAGDTLGEIALRANTTSETLAVANCLENPDLLQPGQRLYVPVVLLPPTTTPTPQPGGIPDNGVIARQGQVLVSPYANFDGTWYEVQPGVPLTLSWPEAVGITVEFYLAPTGTGATGILLGRDTNLSNGAAITWTAQAGSTGHLYARAYAGDGVVETLTTVGLYTVDDAPVLVDLGYASIEPYLAYDAVTYTLQAGATVTLTWADARRDAGRVVFYLRDLNAAPDAPRAIIGVDDTPADGATATWTVPANLWGSVSAAAFLPDGTQQHTVWEPYVQAGTP